MIRRLPLVPTLIVLLAVATMIGLGFWQLQRAGQKEALLARYQAAFAMPPLAWPTQPMSQETLPLFRRSNGMCLRPVASKVTAGRNMRGESGYIHLVDCSTGAEGPGMRVDIGWSRDPRAGSTWSGGRVEGIVAPDAEKGMRLTSAIGIAGLEQSAPPSVEDIPNNHRSYAVQWFLFALTALVVYGLALRARLQKVEE